MNYIGYFSKKWEKSVNYFSRIFCHISQSTGQISVKISLVSIIRLPFVNSLCIFFTSPDEHIAHMWGRQVIFERYLRIATDVYVNECLKHIKLPVTPHVRIILWATILFKYPAWLPLLLIIMLCFIKDCVFTLQNVFFS